MSDHPEYISRAIWARMMPIYKEKYRLPFSSKPVEWLETGKASETQIDAKGLAALIEEFCNDLSSKGYEVISIIPINSGRTNTFSENLSITADVLEQSEALFSSDTRTGSIRTEGMKSQYAYGFSVTDCVVITACTRGL